TIPPTGTTLTWVSRNPAIATVAKITNGTAEITSVANGSTYVVVDFDAGSSFDSVKVDIQQTPARLQLSSRFGIKSQIDLASKTDTVHITATPLDIVGNALTAGAAGFGTLSFTSDASVNASVASNGLTTAVVTANNNTSAGQPVKIWATSTLGSIPT